LRAHRDLRSFPTRRSSDLARRALRVGADGRDVDEVADALLGGDARDAVGALDMDGVEAVAPALPQHADAVDDGVRADDDAAHRIDRKSTRLNSSHVKISYA